MFFFVFFFFFFFCFVFLNNSGFIVSNYRKSLILPGYDVNKCEWFCIGVSTFNLAREWGPLGPVTATRGFGKPCNLLTGVNHLVKGIVLVNLAVWQVCRFPHYRLSMRGGNKKPYEYFTNFI